ncbi:hypothetical protein Tco_1389300 [Tanacetum coccineum]
MVHCHLGNPVVFHWLSKKSKAVMDVKKHKYGIKSWDDFGILSHTRNTPLFAFTEVTQLEEPRLKLFSYK